MCETMKTKNNLKKNFKTIEFRKKNDRLEFLEGFWFDSLWKVNEGIETLLNGESGNRKMN